MQNPENHSSTPTHEEIAARAHAIWEHAGQPEGQEREHWLQAERELSRNDERGEAQVQINSAAPEARAGSTTTSNPGSTRARSAAPTSAASSASTGAQRKKGY